MQMWFHCFLKSKAKRKGYYIKVYFNVSSVWVVFDYFLSNICKFFDNYLTSDRTRFYPCLILVRIHSFLYFYWFKCCFRCACKGDKNTISRLFIFLCFEREKINFKPKMGCFLKKLTSKALKAIYFKCCLQSIEFWSISAVNC